MKNKTIKHLHYVILIVIVIVLVPIIAIVVISIIVIIVLAMLIAPDSATVIIYGPYPWIVEQRATPMDTSYELRATPMDIMFYEPRSWICS